VGSAAKDFGQAASQIIQAVAGEAKTLGRAERAVQRLPRKRVDSFLGRKTLGTPTVAQLLRAAGRGPAVRQRGGASKLAATGIMSSNPQGNRGRLSINGAGLLVTPQARTALQRLKAAQIKLGKSGASLATLHQQFPELGLPQLRGMQAAQRRTGTPAALLAGIISQESNYGQSTLPGVHSGQNFAGAAGEYQIGNGTGAAGDSWGRVAEELWGAKAGQHSIYNPRDAALGAGQYLKDAGATRNPSTWYDAAFSYNHADWYAQEAVSQAEQHLGLNKLGSPPDPKAVARVQQATVQAEKLGIKLGVPMVTPDKLATVPGKGRYVFPFPANKGWVWSRTDQGTDFAYTQEGAPIRALGSGVIISTGAPGWPGGGGFLLKLDHAEHLPSPYIYVYEGVAPTVSAGDRVKAGQTIATGAGFGSLEIGYATADGGTLAQSEGDVDAVSHYSQAGQAMTDFLHMIEKGKKRIPMKLLQVGGSLSPETGGVVAEGGVPSAVVAPAVGGAAPTQRAPLRMPAAPLPLPNSTAVASILPALYRQFQLGEGEEEGGPRRATIKQLSRRGV
jgi:murein DD-endopeptidase MepM/ murein hydrolase activator NlpD